VHLLDGEQAELVHLTQLTRSRAIGDVVGKAQPARRADALRNVATRDVNRSSIDLHRAGDAIDELRRREEWLEEWLDDHDATRRDVPAQACHRRVKPWHAHRVGDRAEQAHHRVVRLAEREVGHVRDLEPRRRQLAARDRDERRIEIDASDREAMLRRQPPRVLARAARDVEDRVRRRMRRADQRRDLARFIGVVFDPARRSRRTGRRFPCISPRDRTRSPDRKPSRYRSLSAGAQRGTASGVSAFRT
jgi:hypothetical protein